MNRFRIIIICCLAVFAFTGCKKDKVDYKYPQPFDGQTVQLPGISGNEEGFYAANSVFVDFSKGVVSTARRDSWNLGLYPGADFKAIINHSMGAMAINTGKTDIAAVGAADSIAITQDLTNGTLDFRSSQSSKRIDPVIGTAAEYLSGLTLVKVGATEGESPVYIVSSGMAGTTRNRIPPATGPIIDPSLLQFPWYKFKVYQTVNGYTVKYGLLNAQAFSPATINKNLSYNFNYMSFNSKNVNVEPAKSLWDIEWTWTTYKDANGKPDSTNNFVMVNYLGGVGAIQYTITATKTFENFTAADLANVKDEDYVRTRDAIGEKWRDLIADPNDATKTKNLSKIKGNLFYVIKDGEGNVYKLRFKTSSNLDGGAMGRPVIEYRLVQGIANPSL
ncbi:hypothetical protein HDE68_004515 [Pedobacter cryoconitis]|uniref:Heme-binding HmuY-like protein n=1 Tax=Pedobacter cryoconitis TaxID=188932 RepID=A0A7W8ZQY3_9SPHI|nr:HmuY family protein [Pedobacter cryoconitis]MBB5638583.1 hypothetical protein [Pedobacter cryoconitis]